MEIYRDEHAQNFTTIYNQVARDNRLSLRASGMLLHFLSLPPGWRITLQDLAEMRPEGLDAIKTAFRELCALGYAKVYNERDTAATCTHDTPRKGGHVMRKVKIYETPQSADSPAEVGSAESGKIHSRSDQGKRGISAGPTESGSADPRLIHPVSKDRSPKIEKSSSGSTPSSLGRAAGSGSRGKPRERDDDTKIRLMWQAEQQVYGAVSTEREDALRLWAHLIGDRQPRDPVRYLAKIFNDTPDVDSLLSNAPYPYDDEPAEVKRCSRCKKYRTETGTDLCVWCAILVEDQPRPVTASWDPWTSEIQTGTG